METKPVHELLLCPDRGLCPHMPGPIAPRLFSLSRCHPCFDLVQPLLDVCEIRVRRDPSLIANLGTCFETPDSLLEGGTIDHPPNEDDQRRNERSQESSSNCSSEGNALEERKKRKSSPKARQANSGCCHHSSPIPPDEVRRMSAPHFDLLALGNHYDTGIAHCEALRIPLEVVAHREVRRDPYPLV